MFLMQFCCLLISEGAAVKLPCSLFVVCLFLKQISFFSFLLLCHWFSAFWQQWHCLLTWLISFLPLPLNLLTFCCGFVRLPRLCVRWMASLSSLCLNHLNKNRERYRDLSKCILLLTFSNSLKWNTTWKFISKYLLESLKLFDDIISSNNQWLFNVIK